MIGTLATSYRVRKEREMIEGEGESEREIEMIEGERENRIKKE